ncbi:MAG: TSUP family transporter, partial [Actinomycetota bacterium]|nr:TSUP family transporter [Actinomycetota bacterium]
NVASALIFVVIAQVDWLVVALLAFGAIVGGQVGAKAGRRLPPTALRAFIVVVGVAGIVQLVR